MSTTDTPAVARRRVSRALRQARLAKNLTQGQVADEMRWSLSKVMRIEKGEVNVSPGDLRVLLDFFAVTEPARVEDLNQAATIARRERYTADSRYRRHLTPDTRKLMQFETRASEIRYFSLVLIPGLLQTESYSRAVMRSYADNMDEKTIQMRLEARRLRQARVFERDEVPHYLVILDESVLYREIGGADVMGEQFQTLLDHMTEHDKVLIRVLPFTMAAPIALLGPFILLDMGDAESVLYREGYLRDEILQKPDEIKRHREIFEELWPRALGDAESADRIRRRADEMLAAARPG